MQDVGETQPGDERADAGRAPAPAGQGFSMTNRARSFLYAGRGVAALLAREHNAWIHAAATIAVVAMGFVLGVSALEWCALILAITAVWVAEAFNTAIEALADAVSTDWDPLIGKVKDIAAGGVLVAAIGAAAVGLIVLGPPLLELLR